MPSSLNADFSIDQQGGCQACGESAPGNSNRAPIRVERCDYFRVLKCAVDVQTAAKPHQKGTAPARVVLISLNLAGRECWRKVKAFRLAGFFAFNSIGDYLPSWRKG